MFCNFAFCQCVMMEAVSRVFCQVGGRGWGIFQYWEGSFNSLGVSKLLFLLCPGNLTSRNEDLVSGILNWNTSWIQIILIESGADRWEAKNKN